MAFELDPVLAGDCWRIGTYPLSLVLLMDQAALPWFILVPRRVGVTEIHQLREIEQMQLMRESCSLSKALMAAFEPDKLNIAAIGNRVPQLHIHHVVRYHNDPVWPDPVWGSLPAKPYTESELRRIKDGLVAVLSADPSFEPRSVAGEGGGRRRR